MPKSKPLDDDDRSELVAYLDGELQGDAQRRVENRLVTDATVRAEADSLKRAWELLDYLPQPEPSNNFTERTLTRVSIVKAPTLKPRASVAPAPLPWHRQPIVAIAACAAAAILAFGVGYALTPRPRPTTPADVDPDTDALVAREPTVIENLPLYLAAENLDYLLALDQSLLFAEDGAGR